MCVFTGECFIVDDAVRSDTVTDADKVKYKDKIEKADRAELQSFVDEKIFRKVWAQQASTRAIDAVWVRRWKQDPKTKEWIIKSRLCIRGFLDPQKSFVSTRSTTATRLSQRLLLSLSALMGWSIESWDVGVAFLKGFSFKQMEEAFRKKGIKAPRRKVYLSPPHDVWEHFRHMPNCPYQCKRGEEHLWLLELTQSHVRP